jgi:hypothetical protein
LTEQETHAYIAEHQITPIATQQLTNATFILYEQPNQNTGYWYLSVTSEGQLTEIGSVSGGTYTPMPGQTSPPRIASVLGSPSGRPFIAVIIHDQQAVERVHSVEVVFANGQRVTRQTNKQRGIIIDDPAAAQDWNSITLYTETGEVVYRMPS